MSLATRRRAQAEQQTKPAPGKHGAHEPQLQFLHIQQTLLCRSRLELGCLSPTFFQLQHNKKQLANNLEGLCCTPAFKTAPNEASMSRLLSSATQEHDIRTAATSNNTSTRRPQIQLEIGVALDVTVKVTSANYRKSRARASLGSYRGMLAQLPFIPGQPVTTKANLRAQPREMHDDRAAPHVAQRRRQRPTKTPTREWPSFANSQS